jgi:DNA-binding CsgD family transcriptional regulator
MDNKRSCAIARIRQACCSGLPSRSFMPIVIAELRTLIPAACGQFTWANDSGRLANFWSDTFMPRRTAWIILHHRRYEADAGLSFRELVLFGRPTGNLRVWWERGFERSATYAAVFEPYGFRWFLDGVVRDAMRPYGCLALIRRHDEPDFSAGEEELLAQVLPYVAHGMRGEATRPSRFVRAAGRSALILCDEGGTVLEWSDLAHQLAVFALVDQINLDAAVAGDDFSAMQTVLRDIAVELRERIDAGAPGTGLPALVRRNGWGEFVFRGYRLSGPGGSSQRLGVLIEQLMPFEAHLLERVNATSLTTRQKEIALLSAKGTPNADIARRLNITPQTLKDYFKAIYARLEINSHQQLVERLSADAAVAAGDAHPPPRWDSQPERASYP